MYNNEFAEQYTNKSTVIFYTFFLTNICNYSSILVVRAHLIYINFYLNETSLTEKNYWADNSYYSGSEVTIYGQ